MAFQHASSAQRTLVEIRTAPQSTCINSFPRAFCLSGMCYTLFEAREEMAEPISRQKMKASTADGKFGHYCCCLAKYRLFCVNSCTGARGTRRSRSAPTGRREKLNFYFSREKTTQTMLVPPKLLLIPTHKIISHVQLNEIALESWLVGRRVLSLSPVFVFSFVKLISICSLSQNRGARR